MLGLAGCQASEARSELKHALDAAPQESIVAPTVTSASAASGDRIDQDADGFTTDDDCNDNDPAIRPGVSEDVSYDGIDRNCDGYDVPVWQVEQPGDLVSWNQGALCPVWALAVVGLERVVQPPGGAYLQVGGVGTRDVFDARLVLRQIEPVDSEVVTIITLPQSIPPNQVFRTERINAGSYEVTFDYGPAAVLPDNMNSEAGAASTAPSLYTYSRCPLVQTPFVFSTAPFAQ